MENIETDLQYMPKNSHRSFSKVQSDDELERGLTTRTSRAKQAVLRAQQIVSKNNEMVEELKKRNNILTSGEYLN